MVYSLHKTNCMFKYFFWRVLLEFCWNDAICYIPYYFFMSLICLWYHIAFSHFKWNHHFTIWSNLVFCIIFVMIIFIYRYVWMNILIIINFLHRKSFFPLYLMRKIYDINKSTHGVSLIMVITQVFHAPIFWSFDQRDSLQRVCIMLWLNSLNSYSSYSGLYFWR